MAGFFKKVAGAFVEIEDDGSDGGGAEVDPSELSADAAALLAEIEAGAAASPAEASAPRSAPAAPAGGFQVGMAFEQIYTRGGVTASPYTAETLLRVIDGLRAMPPAQALQTVKAFDDADPRWTVGDVLVDAENKIDALRGVQGEVAAHLNDAEQRYSNSTASQRDQVQVMETDIRKKIAELEAILQEAHTTAATQGAAALSDLEATRQSCSQENERLDSEVRRLSEVRQFLADPNTLGPR